MTYAVKSGETLDELSIHWGVSPQHVIAATPQLRDPNRLDDAQEVSIPTLDNGGDLPVQVQVESVSLEFLDIHGRLKAPVQSVVGKWRPPPPASAVGRANTAQANVLGSMRQRRFRPSVDASTNRATSSSFICWTMAARDIGRPIPDSL